MDKTSFQLSQLGFLFVFSMSSIGSGCYKLSELMSNHIFCYIYRHMFSSVMDSNCVSNKGREDCGTA